MQLTKLQIALVAGNSISRVLRNYALKDQNAAIKKVMLRIRRMMISRSVKNPKEYKEAIDLENKLWRETTMSFRSDIPLFVVDTVVKIYNYYEKDLSRFANVTPKLMERISICHNDFDDGMEHLEHNANNLSDKYVEVLEPYTGISLKKSIFSGKKNIIKNDMILDGIKVKDEF